MSSYFINATEKSIIEELDRIIDWHIDNDKPIDRLILSLKQSKQFTRLVKKAEKYDKLYYSDGDVDLQVKAKGRLDANVYRGVALFAKPERRRYSKKALQVLPL